MKIVTDEDEGSVIDAFAHLYSTDARDRTDKIAAPIYEKLAPNEVFIISLQGDTIIYVVNRLGIAELKQATLEE